MKSISLNDSLFLDPITSVRFSGDKMCILASTLDSKVRLFDKEDGQILNEYEYIDTLIKSIYFSLIFILFIPSRNNIMKDE